VEGAPYRSAFDIVQTAMKDSLEDIEQQVDPVLLDEATH
jgi:hypothetical protein